MNEAPKSIWKKSWTGPHWLRAWLILTVATFVIFFIIMLFLPGGPRSLLDWVPGLAFLLGVSLVIATVFVGFWLGMRSLFNWRNFRRLLFGLVCFVTLVALIYAEEDFRGKRTWDKFKQEWEAKGEKFDWQAFIPRPVPDDQNFALTPLFQPIYDFYRTTNGVQWRDTNALAHLNQIGIYASDRDNNQAPNWAGLDQGKLTDLEAWQNYYRGSTNFPQPKIVGTAAMDVLVALGKFDAEMNELREAAVARPASRFPIHYEEQPPFGILLPHLAHMKRFSQLFLLRSIALMESGRSEEALADVQTGFRLSDSIRDEPFLIDHLVRIAVLSISLQGVREGLARHAWNDAQLSRLEKYLGSLDILAEANQNMRGERSLGLGGLEYYRRLGFRGRPDAFMFVGENGQAQNSSMLGGFSVLPGGWYYQNELAIAGLHQKFILAAVDEKQHRVFPDIANGLTNAVRRMRTTPYNLFGKLLMPAFAKTSMTTARSQTFVDEACLACALERYRLANGHLPDTLDTLVPQFIEKVPNDVMDGKPLRYRKNSDGSYVLYSIGWNQTDDGGIVVLGKGKTPGVDANRGDWVWPMPAK